MVIFYRWDPKEQVWKYSKQYKASQGQTGIWWCKGKEHTDAYTHTRARTSWSDLSLSFYSYVFKGQNIAELACLVQKRG